MRPETFPLPLNLRALSPSEVSARKSKSQLYEVVTEFVVAVEGMEPSVVAAKSITDFASIPRPVWSIISPEDPIILMPSVGHDSDYAAGRDRAKADERLRRAMLDAGAPAWKAWAVWKAVSWFGSSHWKPASP